MSEGGALRELVAYLGFEVDDKELKHADESMKKATETAKHWAEAVIVAFAVDKIGEFLKGQVEMATQLARTSQVLGTTTDDLQAFNYAAATVGISAEEADGALKKYVRTTGKIASPENIAKTADELAKLPDAGARGKRAVELFGRSGQLLLPILSKGSKGINALYGEFAELGGGLSEDFIANAEEAEHQTVKFNYSMKGLANTIVGPLLEGLMPVVDAATDFAKQLRTMTQRTPIVTTALWTLVTVSAVLAAIWVAMNIEIFAIIFGLALLLLGIEDFVGFLQGKDSVIGDFLDDAFGPNSANLVRGFFKDTKKQFGDIIDKVSDELLPALKDLWNAFNSDDGKQQIHNLNDALSVTSTIVHDIADVMKTIIGAATTVSTTVADIRKKLDPEAQNNAAYMTPDSKVKPGARGALDGLVHFAGRHMLGGIPAAIGDLGQAKAYAGQIFGGGGGGGGGSSTHIAGDNTNQTNIDVTVSGGMTNTDTGAAVAKAIREQQEADRNAAFAAVGGGG